MEFDLALHQWLQAHRDPWVTQAMLWISAVHSTGGLLGMAAVLVMLMRSVGEKLWALVVVIGVPGAMLLNVAVKNWAQRARPVVTEPVVVLHTYGFPSGHAAGTAALYTCAAAWIVWRTRKESRALRAAVVAVAVFMTLWVGASRVTLGVHYLTDVLGGMTLGTLWALFSIAAVSRGARWWLSRK